MRYFGTPATLELSSPADRHQLVFALSSELILGALKGVMGDLPADARLVGVAMDPFRGCAQLLIESREFAPVPELATPPTVEAVREEEQRMEKLVHTRIRGVCLRSSEEQVASGKGLVLPPVALTFDPERWYDLTLEFHEDASDGPVIGQARVNLVDGRIIARAEIWGDVDLAAHPYLACGAVGRVRTGNIFVEDIELKNLAITSANKDGGLPPYEIFIRDEPLPIPSPAPTDAR